MLPCEGCGAGEAEGCGDVGTGGVVVAGDAVGEVELLVAEFEGLDRSARAEVGIDTAAEGGCFMVCVSLS